MSMAVVQAWPKGGFEADMALERIQSGHLHSKQNNKVV